MLEYDLENIKLNHVGSEVLTAVVMKSPIFWDIKPCSQAAGFEGAYHLNLILSASWCLTRIIFYSEESGSMFL
jgi:hypothetical protein